MAKLDLKKSIRGLSFFTKKLMTFGTRERAGDQAIFDRRGAIIITNQEHTKKNGEIINIRSVKDAGNSRMSSADPMVLSRPGSNSKIDPARAMDAFHGWPYTTVEAIADEIAGIEWKVCKWETDEEFDTHPLIDFLESVNDFQTGPEFKHMLAQHLELTGNAFILLGDVTDYDSQPKSMHLLDPSRVRISLDKTTYPFKVTQYEFTIDSRTFKYQPYEIIQLKYPNPSNSYLGIGRMQGIAEWIDNDNNATEFLRQFFQNGAQLGLVFETDMSGEEQLMSLRDSFNEQHSGVHNAYKGVFLPKGVKKPASDIQFKDLGLPDLSTTSRDRILAGFRVPKTILGAAESETNRATAETADYVFAKRTVKPKIKLICSYLNEFLTPRFGEDIYLSFVDPVTKDAAAEKDQMTAAVANQPVLTINEARQKYLGLEPVEGGDKLMVSNTFVPVGMPADQTVTASMNNKTVTKSRLGYKPPRRSKGKTQFARNAQIRKEIKNSLTDKITEIFLSVKKKSLKEMTDQEYDDVILKEKRERASQYALKIKDELEKLNNEQKQEVIGNLKEAIKSVKAIDADSLFDMDKWISLTVNAIKPIAEDLFTSEADQALKLIDKPGLDIVNTPSAQKAIDHAMSLMSESYNQSTVDLLEAKLNEGLEQGYGVQKLGELVDDIYQWKNQYAAERVALTESNRISNTAGKIAWKESKVVKQIKWVTSNRDNVCQFCLAQDGKVIDIDDNFFDKGDTITGEDGDTTTADYSAVGGPPLHPNCHCGIKPVVSTEIESAVVPDKEKVVDEEMQKRIAQIEEDRNKDKEVVLKVMEKQIQLEQLNSEEEQLIEKAIEEISHA